MASSADHVVSDRQSELRAFDDTKAGVKGLVDAKITKIPSMFIDEAFMSEDKSNIIADVELPILDLTGIVGECNNNSDETRAEVVKKIGEACESWGFFQVVNHGIPAAVMEAMIAGIRGFHEQEVEVKKEFYSREFSKKKVLYHSNFNLYQVKAVQWRDTLTCVMAPNPPSPQELPAICRDILMDYLERVMNVGVTITELLSEALGLNPSHLKEMGVVEGVLSLCHYYPACPEPEKAMGVVAHSDTGFFTILLQDQMGGLQVLHQDKWFNVTPVPGALIVNMADILQLISNGKFLSVRHRVVAKSVGPRISVACIFRTHFDDSKNADRAYGPIEQLISAENPRRYREATVKDFVANKHKGNQATSILESLKI